MPTPTLIRTAKTTDGLNQAVLQWHIFELFLTQHLVAVDGRYSYDFQINVPPNSVFLCTFTYCTNFNAAINNANKFMGGHEKQILKYLKRKIHDACQYS